MIKSAFLFLLSLLFLHSCGTPAPDALKSIEGMQQDIQAIERILIANQIDTLAALRMAANNVELRIKNYYDSDTLNNELGKKMDKFKVMRRSLGPLSQSYSTIKWGIIDERKVLNNLIADRLGGHIDKEKYQEYLSFEKEKVDQLRKLLAAYQEEKDKTMRDFFQLYKELNAFSMACLKRHNAKMNKEKRRL
jgi:bacterioferritin (cytochrome b1)